ncbi:MAG: ABC transporter permease subunit [Clostridiales bacterium]|nr:ABC transporter permease subunit [Clostridiales bacterium]
MTLASTGISYLLGLPLGLLLVLTDRDGIMPKPSLSRALGMVINCIRSLPFIILLVVVMPVTRAITGTTVGSKAMLVPLVIAATPYIARVVEGSIREIDAGVIEAAQAMGASPLQIVLRVMLPEAGPSLLIGATVATTTILGYSALSGIVGGGGLGAIAINYGYYRRTTDIMMVAVVLLVLLVQLVQEFGGRIARRSDRRLT